MRIRWIGFGESTIVCAGAGSAGRLTGLLQGKGGAVGLVGERAAGQKGGSCARGIDGT